MRTQLGPRLFTVDEYHRMAEAGILCEDDRVELVEGEIIEMPPIGSQHASIVDTISDILRSNLTRQRAIIRVQGPIRLGEKSEPEPDVSILAPRIDAYRDSHPGAADVLLLIEVSDTTLAFDTGRKQALYADAGVREYWVVDITGRRIEVYRGPTAGNYKQRLLFLPGESIAPLAFPEVSVAVSDVLVP